MNKFYNNLKRQAQENPIVALAITAAVFTATAKLMEANNNRTNAKAWKQEVDRRVRNTH